VAIETADIAALKTSQITAITTANVAVLGTAQIVALTTGQIASLTTSQLAALTTAQAAAIETADIAALRTGQISALSTANVVALTTSQVQALTTASLNAMTTSQLVAIETTDVAALRTAQIAALTTANLVALTTDQIATLNSSQVGALTTFQVEALTTAQIQAISTSAISALHMGTPIVLDLNGDGVSTQSIRKGVTFDLFANGNNVNTGWVSSTDGLLVMDRNHDGVISDGTELFGGATKLSDGSTAADGYAALRDLDANQDGVIDKNDAAFADLKVWVDANSDGLTEAGELKSLESLGISSISAVAEVNLSKDNGNLIGLTSTYQTTDGATHAAADVWFVADANQVNPAANPPVLAAAAGSSSVNPLLDSEAPDLRSQVSSLAQALSAFASTDSTAVSAVAPTGGSSTSTNSPTTLAVGGMVSAMQQFDANGNLIKSGGPAAAPVTSLNLAGTQTATEGGVLASAVSIKPTST